MKLAKLHLQVVLRLQGLGALRLVLPLGLCQPPLQILRGAPLPLALALCRRLRVDALPLTARQRKTQFSTRLHACMRTYEIKQRAQFNTAHEYECASTVQWIGNAKLSKHAGFQSHLSHSIPLSLVLPAPNTPTEF